MGHAQRAAVEPGAGSRWPRPARPSRRNPVEQPDERGARTGEDGNVPTIISWYAFRVRCGREAVENGLGVLGSGRLGRLPCPARALPCLARVDVDGTPGAPTWPAGGVWCGRG